MASIEQIAREVIAGKWGNGEERKRRLMGAGYDYYVVQAEVGRLLKNPSEATPVPELPPLKVTYDTKKNHGIEVTVIYDP